MTSRAACNREVPTCEYRKRDYIKQCEESERGITMATTTVQIADPAKAKEYYAAKMAFTTGQIEAERMIKQGENVTIIDVRAAEDFAKGHVPGAVSLPQDKWGTLQGLQKNKTNVLYCYSHV